MDKMSDWLREIDFSDPKYLDFFDTGYAFYFSILFEYATMLMIVKARCTMILPFSRIKKNINTDCA